MRKEVIGDCVLYNGDCLEVLPELSGLHACVTDPPYHLTSVTRRLGNKDSTDARGFMGLEWDGGDISFNPGTWTSVYNTLLPGAHLVAFAGTRTYHRMAQAIEGAGFEIRDMLAWLYGSGFPKGRDISKDIDRAAGVEREVVAREARLNAPSGIVAAGRESSPVVRNITIPATAEPRRWQGWNTSLKPAHEPICLARKALIGSVAQNVLQFGTGAINVDATTVGEERERTQTQGAYNGSCDEIAGRSSAGKEYPDNRGRWPANVLHDASIEIVEALPFEFRHAVRFFYAAKASKEEREDGLKGAGRQWVDGSTVDTPYNRGATKRANHHPTVKPIALMAWLCRLITPPAGRVLDPFMGSSSTGIAAVLQGFAFVGIEREPDYFDIACRRIESALRKPDLFAEDATAQRREASNDIVQELPL